MIGKGELRYMPSQRRPTRPPHPKASEPQLDLSQFASLDAALVAIEPRDRYLDIGKLLLPLESGFPLTMAAVFWFSMLSRTQGLHEAIAREIRANNPHAAFPLIRAFAEAFVLVVYVLDHPTYVEALSDRARYLPRKGPKRKTMQSLIQYASKHATGIKAVYAELSEATHFGATAMWASYSIESEDESGLQTLWSSHPRWRNDEQALIACAQTLELADGLEHFLREFAVRHVLPLQQAPQQ